MSHPMRWQAFVLGTARQRIANGRFSYQRIQVCLMPPLRLQLAWLAMLGLPVASIAWTVTHEEVLREARQYCPTESVRSKSLVRRKFFYLFTCEYCLSHYLAMGVLLISHYKLLFSDWRGYFVAFFALVWVANLYMSAYNRLRLDIKHEQVEIKKDEEKVDNKKAARARG
jgi:hypothetical protein